MSGTERLLDLRQNLTTSALKALVTDQVAVVRVRNYYQALACHRLSQRVLATGELEPYTHEEQVGQTLVQSYYGVDRLGVPFNSTYGLAPDHASHRAYFAAIAPSQARLRALAEPFQSPIDRLRIDLDECHPSGATVASFAGEKLLAGMIRVTHAQHSHLGSVEPHFDALPEQYARLDAQFAANVYLQVPARGGQIELWDTTPLDPLQTAPRSWRSLLGAPSFVLQPESGDLILFNCRRPHAVGSFHGAPRISAQMFIGHRTGEPLWMWN